VKLSVKTDYATRAVLGLARHYPVGVAVPAETLAAAQGAPGKFLIQILAELKAQGIVRSVRGVAGGYLLARPPADITLADVLEAVDGPLFDAPALSAKDCPPELRRAFERVRQSLDSAARAITFQQLLEESAEKEKMYYI
jgi:Rrf2 family protein